MNIRKTGLCLLVLLLSAALPLAAGGRKDPGPILPEQEQARGVPWYGQREYGNAALGDSRKITIATHGCALSCCAMVFSYYGADTDPTSLNRRLLKADAFAKGWDDDDGSYLGKVRIIWDKAAAAYPEIGGFLRQDFKNSPADLALIRSYLDKNIPVIAEVLRPGNIPHFVVIYAYGGEDFLIRDPLDKQTLLLKEAYNIADSAGSGAVRNIYGIRVFTPSP